MNVSICLLRSLCLLSVSATAFGEGVYFAVNSAYSIQHKYAVPDALGMKRIYQALVLTGDYTVGKGGLRVLPDNPGKPGIKFDTAVDNVNNPNMFVIFLDNQAYPNYLITFW